MFYELQTFPPPPESLHPHLFFYPYYIQEIQVLKTSVRFSVKRFFRYWYLKVVRLRENPHSVALGLSTGVFVGCLPIIPLQTVVAVGFAFFIRCSKIAAALGTWITNPLYAPFVYYGLYLVGRMIIPTGKKEFEPEDLTLLNLINIGWDFFWLMFFGGVVVGMVLACCTYLLSVRIIRAFHNNRDNRRRVKRLKRI